MLTNFPALQWIGFNPTGDLGGLTSFTRARNTVWFPKAPPLTPATDWQRRQRDKLRMAAQAWKATNDEERNRWRAASRRAQLYLPGYQLYIWYQLVRDRAKLATIERQSGVTLL